MVYCKICNEISMDYLSNKHRHQEVTLHHLVNLKGLNEMESSLKEELKTYMTGERIILKELTATQLIRVYQILY